MRKSVVVALFLLGAGLVYADHTYESIAEVHDIMAIVQKPSMDQLAAIMKAGGPQSDEDWKHCKAHASILSETSQLMLMGGRVKDQAWTDGAMAVIEGSKAGIAAATAKDAAAWKESMGLIGKGCRTCHKVHKPPTEHKAAD